MPNISVINKSSLASTTRIDSEYYQPHHLVTEKRILTQANTSLASAGAELDCSAFYPSIVGDYNFSGKGMPFLRVNEIQAGLVRLTENTAFLPTELVEKYKSNIAKAYPGDIVIAKGGNTLGKVGLLTDRYPEYAVCRDLIIVRTSNLKNLNKYYVWMFLNSEVGKQILLRTASLTGQPHLTLGGVANINLPILGDTSVYEKTFLDSRRLAREAANQLKEVRAYILSELGLARADLNLKASYATSLSETNSVKRIDPQYFNPTYQEVETKIKSYPGGWDTLSNLFIVSEARLKPEENSTYDYIELSNLDASVGQIIDSTQFLGAELPGRARMVVSKDDLLVASVEGSIKKIAWIKEENKSLVASTGFFVLGKKYYSPLVGYALLSSSPVNDLLKREAQGSILTAVQNKSLSRIVVPKLSQQAKDKIENLMITSDKAYEESVSIIKKSITSLDKLYGSSASKIDLTS